MVLSEKLSIMYEKAKNLKVLYVEDDLNLQKQTEKFLKKVFSTIFVASNGVDALDLYKKEACDIVITDIKMPYMNGLDLAKYIKEINSKTEVIITSAYDEKDFLLQAIDIGILHYLIKPLKTEKFITTIDKTIDKVLIEKKVDDKHKRLEHMFAFQKNVLILIENSKIKLCNKAFLEFFGVKSLKEFKSKFNFYKKIKLSNTKEKFSTDEELFYYLTLHSDEFFKLKLVNGDLESKNFLLTIDKVPYERDEYTLSFMSIDTILDGNIFARDYTKDINIDLNQYDIDEFTSKFKKIENIDDGLSFYNVYKGLTIYHKGKVLKVYDDKIKVSVDKFQLLAFAYEKRTFIHSEILKKDIHADIDYINIDEQIATLKNFHYLDSSPRFRESTRVEIDRPLHIAYLESENLFLGGEIKDLSTKAISLTNKELSNLELNMDVDVSFYLPHDSDPDRVKIETKGRVFKITKQNAKYLIVVLIELDNRNENEVLKFISKRQIDLIKEFKSKTI